MGGGSGNHEWPSQSHESDPLSWIIDNKLRNNLRHGIYNGGKHSFTGFRNVGVAIEGPLYKRIDRNLRMHRPFAVCDKTTTMSDVDVRHVATYNR